MRLPQGSASYEARVHFGRYVARRLKRARLGTLASSVESATAGVLAKGRAWEDAQGPLQDCLADRDAADGDLDTVARELRLGLASRNLQAIREAPYTSIFSNGIEYYTAAPFAENRKRYGELSDRVTAHLPEGDELRATSLTALAQGIPAFAAAEQALDQARTDVRIAATALDVVEEEWTAVVEKVYGELVSQVGRKAADSFFPRPARSTQEEPAAPSAPPEPPK